MAKATVKAMTKAQLAAHLADKTGLTKKDAAGVAVQGSAAC